jgi:hypothetical protein
MNNMFTGCTNLSSVPPMNASNVLNINSMFYNCPSLTNIGGLIDLGKQNNFGFYNNGYYSAYPFDINPRHQISKESVLNIINNLYDRSTGDYDDVLLILGSQNIKLLTDEEKAIATNKGWRIA